MSGRRRLTDEQRATNARESAKRYRARKALDPEYMEAQRMKSKLYYRRVRKNPEIRAKHNADNLTRYHSTYRPNYEVMERRRARIAGYQRKRRSQFQEKKKQLQQLLGGKCSGCGLDDHRLLDFDHINPVEKLFNISQYLNLPIEDLIPEVKKCQLLCPNCHRLKTINGGGHNSFKFREARNKFSQGFKSLISVNSRREDRRLPVDQVKQEDEPEPEKER